MHFDFFAINIIYFLHYRVGPYMSKVVNQNLLIIMIKMLKIRVRILYLVPYLGEFRHID